MTFEMFVRYSPESEGSGIEAIPRGGSRAEKLGSAVVARSA
jgi:hypothetical protein